MQQLSRGLHSHSVSSNDTPTSGPWLGRRGNGHRGLQQQLVARKACSSRARVRSNASSTEAAGVGDLWSRSQTIPPVEPCEALDALTAEDAASTERRRRRNPGAGASAVNLPPTIAQRHKRADYAPGTRVGQKTQVLLARQLRDLMKNPIPGISVAPDDDDVMTWHAVVTGPEGSPYAGGLFSVDLKFTQTFPGQQPRITFRTKIWHPNIQECGETCVALGESQYAQYERLGGHLKVRSAACVLIGLLMLLSTPNPHNPLNWKAGRQMTYDPAAFNKQAAEWTRMYAIDCN